MIISSIILEIDSNHLSAINELSFIYKRNEDLTQACNLWLKAIEYNEQYAYIELAKWEEHKNKDYKKALEYTEKALNSKFDDYIYEGEEIRKLKHRKRRLETSLEKI